MEPPEWLRALLHDARAYGWSFADAWPQAVRRAAAMSEKPGEWMSILQGTRSAWERAFYAIEAPARERALGALAYDREPDRSLDGRSCEWCGRLVPSDRDPRARFCDEHCKRAWNYVRERRRTEACSDRGSVQDVTPRTDAVGADPP